MKRMSSRIHQLFTSLVLNKALDLIDMHVINILQTLRDCASYDVQHIKDGPHTFHCSYFEIKSRIVIVYAGAITTSKL